MNTGKIDQSLYWSWNIDTYLILHDGNKMATAFFLHPAPLGEMCVHWDYSDHIMQYW